jgi:hypothetical protein
MTIPTMSLPLKSGEQGSLRRITSSMFGKVTQDEEIGQNVNHAPSIERKNAQIALIRGTPPL